MSVKVGINGFGRIGRQVLKAIRDYHPEELEVVAFNDIHPIAPVHVLIIPKRHIESFSAVTDADRAFLASLGVGLRKVAEAEGVAQTGFRVLSNNGPDGGQEVAHLHVHLLGGRALGPMLVRPR